MMIGNINTVLVLLFTFGLLGTGTTLVGLRPAAAEPAETADFLYVAEPEKRGRDAQVVSQRGGYIAFIGVEIKPGEKVASERIVKAWHGGEIKEYRKLQEGDHVEAGQLVASVDDRVACAEYAIKEKQVTLAQAHFAAAKAVADEAEAQVEVAVRINKQIGRRAVSEEELRTMQLVVKKYREEFNAKQAELELAILELKKARTIQDLHEIRSGVSGVVTTIYKYPGEGIRSLEPILAVRVAGK